MHGRRRDPRFALSTPLEASLQTFQDLMIERFLPTELIAIGDVPGDRGQGLTLDLVSSGPRETVQVRVVDSTPVVLEGIVRHRLRLAIVG